MSAIDRLAKTYYDINQHFASLEFKANMRGWNRKEQMYAHLRALNDQAYFLYLFTRFEDHITSQADFVIGKGRSLSTWKRKAPWRELKNLKGNRRLSFMSQVALLTDPGGGNYRKVDDYYKDRNTIAHGGSATIVMPTVISDMKRLQIALRA